MKKFFSYVLTCALIVTSLPFQSSAAIIVPGGGDPDSTTIKAAFAEFNSLSKHDRKLRLKAAKNEWKKFKKERKTNNSAKVDQVVLIILAILLPPLAVYLHQGEINGKFWLSILLWFLIIIPGIIFALLVVTDTI